MKNHRSAIGIALRCLALGTLGAALLLIVFGAFDRLWLGWPGKSRAFQPIRVLDEQPPITEFTVREREAAALAIDDADLVLGVEINGDARAYPINMLTGPTREIINDTLGATPIAATW